MHLELTYLALFAIACLVALAARALKLPFTVALVVAGLGLGTAHVISAPHLTRELLFTILLPGLLFEASFHIELRQLWSNKLAIVGLALPGVLLSVGLTAVLLAPAALALGVGKGFGWSAAVVFAALIAATDPIAVVALFRTLAGAIGGVVLAHCLPGPLGQVGSPGLPVRRRTRVRREPLLLAIGLRRRRRGAATHEGDGPALERPLTMAKDSSPDSWRRRAWT